MSLFVFSLHTISKSYANSSTKEFSNPSLNIEDEEGYVIIGVGKDSHAQDYAVGYNKNKSEGMRLKRIQ